MSKPTDHCICPMGERCTCGFNALLATIFFGEPPAADRP